MLFNPGHVVMTPGAARLLEELAVPPLSLLRRHVLGDWGDLDEKDRRENEFSVKEGYRILSAYAIDAHRKIWIITEADRSSTTILLPEEY